MKTWKIPIRWEACATVDIEADSVEEAIQKAVQHEDEVGYEIPEEWEYIDSSFEVETDEEFIRIFNEDDD